MKRRTFFVFIFISFLGIVGFLQLGFDEAIGESGLSICYSCESCLAAGCPTSNPADPACAAFIASACQTGTPTHSSGYCGDGMCKDTETLLSCPSDCKSGTSQTQTQSSPDITSTGDVASDSSADAGISGTIVDGQGNVLSEVYGFVRLSPVAEHGTREVGGSLERGKFSFKAPAGSYMLTVFFAPDTPYTVGAPQTVTIVSGIITSVRVVVSANTSKITGKVRDQAGNAVLGFDVRIFATSKTGIWQEAYFDRATGQYTLNVAAGTWYLGYEIDPASGFLSFREPAEELVVGAGETVQKDLMVRKAGANIQGKVTDPNGNPVFQAFVGVSETSEDSMVAGTETNERGEYRVAVPAGIYLIKTFVHPEGGFINSEEKSITIKDGETLSIDLRLRKADLLITGKVSRDNKPVLKAFVWGWSSKGGYQETMVESDGNFRLRVTGFDTWTLAAASEAEGEFYKSNEVAIQLLQESVVQDLELLRVGILPASKIQTSEVGKSMVVAIEDGTTVVAPANSISSSGSVSLSITPDTRTPSQGEVKVVGVAYTIEARDVSGLEITKFKNEITVTLPYKEEEIARLGSREEELVMSFWDETAGTWRTLEGSVVNKEENTVTAAVDHLTRFAIVAAADITPPVAPSQLTAAVLADGRIRITWINPSGDFHHAKVYRSQITGQLGNMVAVEVFGSEFIDDKELLGSALYYYTVRAVDPAGNESSNTNQVQVLAPARIAGQAPRAEAGLPPGQATKLQLLQNLTVGSRGEDVRVLQELLLKEGVYPEGLITGYFGNLTRQAVIRFQEKYASQILIPVGLARGTGFVGSSTRKKVNELLGAPVVPQGQLIKALILRDLTLGSSGEDVKVLQQLLVREGVYPEGLITGYFGNLTRQAVIRFQEKYAFEILTSEGLLRGTGLVSLSTRAKMNELLK